MTNESMMVMNGTSGVKRHRHHHKLKHRFRFERTLGKGTYGKVKQATELETGKQVAIKTVPKSKIKDPEDLRRIHQEIEIMSSMVHPHIIAIHEVFENKEKIVLVMEFASRGELYDYADRSDVLEEEEVQRLFRQIVSAVAFCHMNNVVHRDLKLENIFLDESNNVKIGDFGLSSKYDDNDFLYTFCGSPLYASPEIVCGLPYYGPEVDCWSLGVILYALVYRTMPFKDDSFTRLKQNIMAGRYEPVPYPSDAESLIKHMLTVNSKKRATIEDIMGHNWVCGSGSLPSPSEMYLKVQETSKQKKEPVKSILKNSAQSCNSGGSAIQSTSSVFSDPLSDFDPGTSVDGSAKSVASRTSGDKSQSLLRGILKRQEKDGDNKPDSRPTVSGSLKEAVLVSEKVSLKSVSHTKESTVNSDGVVLRKNVQLTSTSETKSRNSVRLSKRMSCGKYSRITRQWEELCRGERKQLEREDEEVEGEAELEPTKVIRNKELEAIARCDDIDNSSSGDDSLILDILSTPVLKKTFSFDFENNEDSRRARRRRHHRNGGLVDVTSKEG